MERKTAGLLGALAGLATMGATGAQAASQMTPAPLPIASYADLLRPVPNAVELLRAHDAELLEQARNAPARVQNVQYYGNDHNHHHHHHHEYYAPPPPPPEYYHHHHHHHHNGGAVIMLPGLGIQVN